MNVFFNGSIAFSIDMEEVSSFYFCPHFKRFFLNKQPVTQVSFLRNEKYNETIAYCQWCRKETRSLIFIMSSSSDQFCREKKIFLILYIPIVNYGSEMFVSVQCVEPRT